MTQVSHRHFGDLPGWAHGVPTATAPGGWSPTLWTAGQDGMLVDNANPEVSAHGLQPMGPSAAHEAAVARGFVDSTCSTVPPRTSLALTCTTTGWARCPNGRSGATVHRNAPCWRSRTRKRSLEGGFGPRWGAFKTSRNHASKGALPRTSGSPSLKSACGVGPRFEGTHPGMACGRWD